MTGSGGCSSLGGIFASPSLVAVLSLFLAHPEADFYQREMAALSGQRLSQVQRELARLQAAGLVSGARRGNRVYYRAAVGHPAFADLQAVFVKTVGVVEVVEQSLRPWRDSIAVAFLFGSLARGRELAGSDIDLCIVGEVDVRGVVAGLAAAEQRTGREINAVVYPVEELRSKAGEGQTFVSELLNGPKLWLIGDESRLGTIVGEVPAGNA
jgi:predicted nucleotidyltransferase